MAIRTSDGRGRYDGPGVRNEVGRPRPIVVIVSAAALHLLATGLLALRNGLEFAPVLDKVLTVVPIALFAIAALVLVRSVGSASLAQSPGQTLYAGQFVSLFAAFLVSWRFFAAKTKTERSRIGDGRI